MIGGTDELPARLEHWDPSTDLTVTRPVEVDLDRLRRETQLGPASTLSAIAVWYSGRTRLAGHSDPIELGDLDSQVAFELGLTVPAERVGGRLDLRTSVVLRRPDPEQTALAPRLPGTILWSDRTSCELEGTAARFPISAVPFSKVARLPEGAAWALDWDPDDLESPVTSAVRLLVNLEREDLLSAIRTGSATPAAAAVQSFMRLDIARAMVHAALQNDRFVKAPDGWEPDTLGRMLADLLDRTWPGVTVSALRGRLESSPGRLDAELQAAIGVSAG